MAAGLEYDTFENDGTYPFRGIKESLKNGNRVKHGEDFNHFTACELNVLQKAGA